ncbi:MAG: ATP synthase F1 subunit gamma [Mesotoga sp.]|uniref:ATP synthase F1 subunit gamma n=1 Tax=Mesotoga sp. TaxID=2053577 RepID=UPI0016AEC590|nr:ATP synthase F1 subunit gamma [Mesotoga sp.]MDD3682023.1 ATP synthase F1 subunit gamma [Mesotoga sp.]MDD4207588.1 ATP synthase F1 subunit gamma [Mesotoga sp.]NLT45064.1 ATP synthase F1 subunit gamma [Thermotogaceae bacterium]
MSKGKLRTIKKRIESTNSTMQITRAMEMVARAKINKVQKGLKFVRLYEKAMARALTRAYFGDTNHPKTGGQGDILLVVSSDMGLAGAFNAEIMKAAEREVEKSDIVHIVTVGIKAESYFKKSGLPITAFSHFYDTPDLDEAAIIVDDIVDVMEDKNASGLKMVFSLFKNPLAQMPKIVRLLPVEDLEKPDNDLFDFEPEIEVLYKDVLNSWLVAKVLQGLYETKVGELFSRQTAMKNATENAKSMIEQLTLVRNKLRQSNITQEIIEVVNGAEALNG